MSNVDPSAPAENFRQWIKDNLEPYHANPFPKPAGLKTLAEICAEDGQPLPVAIKVHAMTQAQATEVEEAIQMIEQGMLRDMDNTETALSE